MTYPVVKCLFEDSYAIHPKRMDNGQYFLRLGIIRDRKSKTISLSQVGFVKKLLSSFCMVGSSGRLPLYPGTKAEQATSEEI